MNTAISKRCSSALREIKQEKRRQSLIENAEKARLSKKLVTLDDHVKLDVPIGDLAVHEPDNKRLIAFLKAMEFNSLMRRVAEFSGVDAGEIEPEARLAGYRPSAAEVSAASPAADGGDDAEACVHGRGARRRSFRSAGRRSRPTCRARAAAKRPANFALTPQMLAAARMEAARTAKFDRAKYETVRSLERLNAWIERARDVGFVAHRRRRPQVSIRCRRSCAAFRSRWRRTRPAMCRLVTARAARAAAAVCSAATLRPTRLPKTLRSMRSSRCSRIGACSRSATI